MVFSTVAVGRPITDMNLVIYPFSLFLYAF